MPIALLAMLLAAPVEHSTAWSAPVQGIRVRLVEAQAEPFLAIEVENVSDATVTFVQEPPMNRETATCFVELSVDFSGCFSVVGFGSFLPSFFAAPHTLRPGGRERVRLFVRWDSIPPGATALVFRAELIAHSPRTAGPPVWTGRVQTPELTGLFVRRP